MFPEKPDDDDTLLSSIAKRLLGPIWTTPSCVKWNNLALDSKALISSDVLSNYYLEEWMREGKNVAVRIQLKGRSFFFVIFNFSFQHPARKIC